MSIKKNRLISISSGFGLLGVINFGNSFYRVFHSLFRKTIKSLWLCSFFFRPVPVSVQWSKSEKNITTVILCTSLGTSPWLHIITSNTKINVFWNFFFTRPHQSRSIQKISNNEFGGNNIFTNFSPLFSTIIYTMRLTNSLHHFLWFVYQSMWYCFN